MDYGPTIAAAFGSYDPKEVDDLRAAIVECMRNTPLNSGIRATGAVRQDRQGDEGSQDGYGDRRSYDEDDRRGGASQGSGGNLKSAPSADESEPAVEEDLLDVNNWNDVPTQGPPMSSPYDQQPPPGAYGAPPPQQQYPYPGQPQQYTSQSYPSQSPQQPGQQHAMVPFAGPPSGYPGAPPPPQQQYGAPPPQQQYGAEAWSGQPQQQQYPPQQQMYGSPPPQYHTPAY